MAAQNKPRVILEIEADGNVNIVSNIKDTVQIHSILKLAADLLVARALKAFDGAPAPAIVPARFIPGDGIILKHKPS